MDLTFRRRKANHETPPNVDNLLASRGQATPSVREKASSQPTEASFFSGRSIKISFTTSRRSADSLNCYFSCPVLVLLSANRSLDRSSPSVHDYPSINSREPVAEKKGKCEPHERSIEFAHAFVAVVDTLQMPENLARRTLSQALGFRW